MLIDLLFVKEVLIVSVNLYVDRSVVCSRSVVVIVNLYVDRSVVCS